MPVGSDTGLREEGGCNSNCVGEKIALNKSTTWVGSKNLVKPMIIVLALFLQYTARDKD